KLVEEDPHVEAKAEAVRIMQGMDIFSGREKQLMDLAGGRTYRYLMQRHFPELRRSDYRIEYTVPEFDLNYGRDMLEHRPGMLSHYELYTIAFTGYPMGSAMFNKVFRTARML
ncbi:putative immunoreactivesantigen domain protein, partial [Bacteroides fragilis str. S23 R14]